MKIKKNIEQKREIYDFLLGFIENEDSSNNIQNLIDVLDQHKILFDKEELREFLLMLLKITENHHRTPTFLAQIKKIFVHIKNSMKSHFSDDEIFNFFKHSKYIIYYLFKDKIIIPDPSFFSILYNDKICINASLNILFFYNEIKSIENDEFNCKIDKLSSKVDKSVFTDFEEKREIGENDSYICTLIRNDSIIEFVSYVNKKSISLSQKVEQSIFETNSFLLQNEPTLIEYAAFFGSIQIFQYLILNNVELTSSLWLYVIHSNNAQMIHLLEENQVEPENKSYDLCLMEAIKCHHNDIANYIQNNLLLNDGNQLSKSIDRFINFKKNFKLNFPIHLGRRKKLNVIFNENDRFEYLIDKIAVIYGYQYHNYSFIEYNKKNRFLLFLLCKYNYYNLVKLLIKKEEININEEVISKNQYFINRISIKN